LGVAWVQEEATPKPQGGKTRPKKFNQRNGNFSRSWGRGERDPGNEVEQFRLSKHSFGDLCETVGDGHAKVQRGHNCFHAHFMAAKY